ncbi:unnamed protein product [Acanthoscelides obtectus]|uniref:Reverse transcriptase domain-containing protein n=1 Tax=Acanthoscelides obtectus TaxID=200917 RepID=A0A9P0LTB2_ACAOB|nr:unnamed protein product [Acanthoscelides obtectus]CAK1655854.1 RNA-directed DNA polymerase from mobile element jockey [Acanthoscelides obtectus]
MEMLMILLVPSIQRVPYTMWEVTFRHKTVRRVLLSLGINKTSGPALIPGIVLKRCAAELAPVLSCLFQMSYESGTFPENWKFAHVQPNPKNGSKTDPYNSRPIALLSVISKVMERCINRELLDYLEQKLCRWVSDFISGRKISVLIDMFSSSSQNVNAGVPQGSVLAPTLFLLHINDLLSCTINPIHSFADDSTLHAGIQSDTPISAAELENRRLATTSSLTRDLETITAWGRNNLVQFDASKTQYCSLTNKKQPSAHPISMDGRVMPKSHTFRLVGVQITEDLIWHEHISSIAAAAGKNLGYLFRAKKYFSPHDLLTLYKAQIRPSLEYCSQVWGAAAPTTLFMLDAVQRRAIRLIDDSSLTDSFGTLSHRRGVGDLALFYRYTNGLCSSELSSMMPSRDVPARQTRLTLASHPNRVELRTSRSGRYNRSFVPRVLRLWNSLQEEAFPSSTN